MEPRIPPPVVLALAGLAMWATDRYMTAGQVVFAGQIPLAGILLAAGLVLMLLAVVQFALAKTTVNPLRPERASQLVTTGVFGLSRNPIYLGDLLVLAAWAVWLGNIFNPPWLALFVWYLDRFQIEPEERTLKVLFGERYAAYRASVRRWL